MRGVSCSVFDSHIGVVLIFGDNTFSISDELISNLSQRGGAPTDISALRGSTLLGRQ